MKAPHGLLGLALLLVGLGAAQGWSLLYTLGYSLALTVVLCFLWSWSGVRWIYVRPRARLLRSQVGATLEERSEVENLAWLPRPWLELLDGGDHPQHNLSQILSLGPLDRRVRILRTRCRRRGQFTLGPIWIASSDPLGLFRHERQVQPATRLVILPATVELPSFGRLPGELTGGQLQAERIPTRTPNVGGVREYAPGDSVGSIHWPTTARRAALMVKEFERDPAADIWLILDLDRLVQAGQDEQSTEEYAVMVAASLGRYWLLAGRAVGLVTQSARLPVDRGPRQLLRLLEVLAVAHPVRRALDDLLLGEVQRFGRRDSLVVVTPTGEPGWVPLCRDLRRRGVRSTVVALDGRSFGPAAPNGGLLRVLEASVVPTYLVRRGDDLALSLSQPTYGVR